MPPSARAVQTEPFDALLVEEIRVACDRARRLAETDGGLPKCEVRVPHDSMVGLRWTTQTDIDWYTLTRVLGDSREFRAHIAELAEAFAEDPHVRLHPLWDLDVIDAEIRPRVLWDNVISPTFRRYGRRKPDLSWHPELARELIANWRAVEEGAPQVVGR
jgi:hypothetical protein